jgi:hypothetical protein
MLSLCLFVSRLFKLFPVYFLLRGFPSSQLDAAAACPQLDFGSNCFFPLACRGGL